MPIDLHCKVVRSDNLMAVPVRDGLAMMHADSGMYYALNEVAAAVWEHMETPVTVETLCAALMNVFDVAPERCVEEVLGLLRILETKGMLHVVE